MPPISHKECGVLLTSSCQHEPVVVNPASGEAKPVKVGSQLLFDEAGWAFLTCPGEEARWVKSILEVSVQKTKDGQVYFHNRATSSTTWQATLSKSSSRRYPVALLDGREWPLSVLKVDLPKDGQLCFWDLRQVQEPVFLAKMHAQIIFTPKQGEIMFRSPKSMRPSVLCTMQAQIIFRSSCPWVWHRSSSPTGSASSGGAGAQAVWTGGCRALPG